MGNAAVCAGCGAAAPRAAARFCGRCGAVMIDAGSRNRSRAEGMARSSGIRGRARGGRTRADRARLVVAGASLAGLAVLAATSTPAREVLTTRSATQTVAPSGGSTEVIGIGPDTPLTGSIGDEAEDASCDHLATDGSAGSGSTAPGPLRCAPDGCDAWQLPAPAGELAASDGVLYLIDDDQLIARDGPFGAVRWITDLRDLVRVTGDGDPISSLSNPQPPAVVRADPDGVIVATANRIVRHDRDGRRRWQTDLPGWDVWDVATVDGRYVVTRSRSPRGGVPFGRISVLDLDDGAERWTRQVTQVHGLTDDLVVTGGPRGAVAAVDLRDGAVRWERRVSQQTAVHVVGPLISLEALFPESRPRGLLLDVSTGSTPQHLDGAVLQAPVLIGEHYVAVLRDPDASDRVRVVSVAADGEVAWSRQLLVITGPDRAVLGPVGDATVRDPDDGTQIDVEAGTSRISLRAADGAFLGRSESRGDGFRGDGFRGDEAPDDGTPGAEIPTTSA